MPKSFALLLMVVSTIQLYFAAAHTWVWPFYGVAMMVVFLVYLFERKKIERRSISKIWLACGGFFFAWTAFQCISIPMNLLAVLSPHRYALLTESVSLTGLSIKWAAISYNISESMAWWILMLILCCLYIVLRHHLENRRRLVLLITVLFSLAALQALYGILQALIPSMGVLGVPGGHMGYSRGTYFNRNHFAGFMEMVFPLCLGYALSCGNWAFKLSSQGGRGKKAFAALGGQTPWFLWAVISMMIFVAVIFSQSRAGITALLLGLIVFSLLVRVTDKRLSYGLWLGIAAIFFVAMLYGLRIGFEGVVARFMEISSGEEARSKVWADSLVILKDHPLGIGLMNFKSVFRVYEVSTSFIGTFRHTHNDILQLLIETGWPGFVALFGGFLMFLMKMAVKVSRMRPHADSMRFFLATGALSGLTSIGFHSFFDFNLQIPANMVFFVILLAIVNVCTEASRVD